MAARIERDKMDEIEVATNVYCGAQMQRRLKYFNK